MENSRIQTLFMIGVALVVMSGIMIYVSLSSPKVYIDDASQTFVVETPSEVENTVIESTEKAPQVIVEAGDGEEEITALSYPLNINKATMDELVTIEGIGEARASAIIEYREAIGGYTYLEQIKDIEGFGDAIFNQIAPYLTV